MKKRVVSLLVVMTMAFLGGCGNQEKTPESTQEQTEQEEAESEETAREETQEETGGQKSSLLTGTFNVPMEDIYVDTPNYHQINQGFTEVFIVPDVKYVTITANVNATTEDLHESGRCPD